MTKRKTVRFIDMVPIKGVADEKKKIKKDELNQTGAGNAQAVKGKEAEEEDDDNYIDIDLEDDQLPISYVTIFTQEEKKIIYALKMFELQLKKGITCAEFKQPIKEL